MKSLCISILTKMKLYKISLRRYLLIALLWAIPLFIVLSLALSLYPIINNNSLEINSFLSRYNNETLVFLNINDDTFSSILGFYTYLFPIFTLLGAFGASHLGLKVMLDDRLNNIQIFLLTKPLTRKEILNNKKLAAITLLVIENIIFNIISLLLITLLKGDSEINLLYLFEINTSLLLLQITFMFITMMISSFFKRPKSLLTKSLIIILLFFILSLIEHTYPNIILSYINPFSYFKVSDILTQGTYQYRFIVASLVIVFYSNTFSLSNYENEDIK